MLRKGMFVLALVLVFGTIFFVSIKCGIAGSSYERDIIGECECDLNGDGVCDMSDWLLFGEDWGRTDCPDLPPAPVERTGQTRCYDTDGNEIDCAGTGQDGDLEKGVAWPNPRFTDNENGTVTDNLTGLIWLKNANCFSFRTWANALSDCNSLANGQCELTDGSVAGDWRLPNVKELESLRHFGFHGPAVPNTAGTGKWSEGQPFIGVQSNVYWSASTFSGYANNVWRVNMYLGTVDGGNKSYAFYVWPVRSDN